MRILYHIHYPEGYGEDRFTYDGYRYAFEKRGHEVFTLTERDSLSAKLDECKPDLFISSINVLDVEKEIDTIVEYRKKGGIVIYQAGSVLPETEWKYIENGTLADHYSTQQENLDFERRTKGKYECHVLPLAALPQYHFPTAPVKKYECDVIFIGANLPRKREEFKRRLLPLTKKYNVKILGGDWDFFDRYILHPLAKIDRIVGMGGVFSRFRIKRQVPIGEENQAFSSAKISLNIHENNIPKAVNARTFRVPACGGFLVSDYLPDIENYFVNGKEIIMPKTDEEWFKKIDYYLTHDKERVAIKEAGTTRALKEHTFFNRADTMLGWLK